MCARWAAPPLQDLSQRCRRSKERTMETSNPVVDAIIPTFNRAYCIANAIDSVLNQTYAHCHAIVVDDGSTDETPALMAARYGGNPRVTYIRQANAGVSAARNTGLKASTGEYVALLDSDDAWKPWKIQLQLDCLRALPGVGMIWTDMDAIDAQGRLVQEKYLRTMYGGYQRISTEQLFDRSDAIEHLAPGDTQRVAEKVYWGDIFSQMVLGNLVHTSTVLLTQERARKVGAFNVDLKYSGEDFDFHLRTCREGPVAYADVASLDYRVGAEDQLTQPAYKVNIACNYLKTVLPVIARDRDRIQLPQRAINAKLGETHAWIADELFRTYDLKGARQSALMSLRHVPFSGRTWLILFASFLPVAALTSLLPAYRHAKQFIAELPPIDFLF
jgi:glycosyltransferase involved in cell wall biosynthesis